MDEQVEDKLKWLPAGTRVLCICDCILKGTMKVLYREGEIYIVQDNNVIISDGNQRITFRRAPGTFYTYFIKLS